MSEFDERRPKAFKHNDQRDSSRRQSSRDRGKRDSHHRAKSPSYDKGYSKGQRSSQRKFDQNEGRHSKQRNSERKFRDDRVRQDRKVENKEGRRKQRRTNNFDSYGKPYREFSPHKQDKHYGSSRQASNFDRHKTNRDDNFGRNYSRDDQRRDSHGQRQEGQIITNLKQQLDCQLDNRTLDKTLKFEENSDDSHEDERKIEEQPKYQIQNQSRGQFEDQAEKMEKLVEEMKKQNQIYEARVNFDNFQKQVEYKLEKLRAERTLKRESQLKSKKHKLRTEIEETVEKSLSSRLSRWNEYQEWLDQSEETSAGLDSSSLSDTISVEVNSSQPTSQKSKFDPNKFPVPITKRELSPESYRPRLVYHMQTNERRIALQTAAVFWRCGDFFAMDDVEIVKVCEILFDENQEIAILKGYTNQYCSMLGKKAAEFKRKTLAVAYKFTSLVQLIRIEETYGQIEGLIVYNQNVNFKRYLEMVKEDLEALESDKQ